MSDTNNLPPIIELKDVGQSYDGGENWTELAVPVYGEDDVIFVPSWEEGVAPTSFVVGLGEFRADTLSTATIGANQAKAVAIYDTVGWN